MPNNMNGEAVIARWSRRFGPRLKPGDIVVMDNLAAHKGPAVIAAIHAVGAEVLFLPPYWPEVNPIEKAWAQLKDILRRLPALSRDTFAFAMTVISNTDVRAWTAFAGYTLGSI